MALSNKQKQEIKELLSLKIEEKLKSYGRETTSMPFLARLIQDAEKIAAYSFIHSMATTLGMSIYEEVSLILASETAAECFTHYGVGGVISDSQQTVIANIISELRNRERVADIQSEKELVLAAPTQGAGFRKSGNIADFYMRRNGREYYFEIKPPKPNIDVFEKSKTKLLEWVARKRMPVRVYLAFPYNPYHPKPYSRFTEVDMMDPPNDFLVGSEYWDFIGGKGSFTELLKTFDEVGKAFKAQLDQKFEQIAREKIDFY
ncbi:MAG: TdeIII family type II restriction endonuclease [Flavobacteriales bacterium]